MNIRLLLLLASAVAVFGAEPRALVGAYYFDGWAGAHKWSGDTNHPWAAGAPTHLTKRLATEFAGREPVWGWRDDTPAIMERQIDLAADAGIGFFAFCWYWHDNAKALNTNAVAADPKHTGLRLYLEAKNRSRLKFALLVANHAGYDITGPANWRAAADHWMPLLTHPDHVRVDGRPLLLIFQPKSVDPEGLAYLQEKARAAGLPGVAVAGCGGGSVSNGFTHRTRYNLVPGYTGGGEQHAYADLVASNVAGWVAQPGQPFIPTLTVGWDCRPWEGPDGMGKKPGWYFPDRTPEQFGASVRTALAWMEGHPAGVTSERALLLYAWNELGEGGWLVPTRDDPAGAYLAALRAALDGPAR